MSAVLFSPHNDDETLFAFYSMVRHRPEVIIVLRSMRQQLEQSGPTYQRRERETQCATGVVGAKCIQWAFHDNDPNWGVIGDYIKAYITTWKPDTVIAPALEAGGHEDHNAVARIVDDLAADFDFEQVRYLTYKRGHGRSEDGIEVVPSPVERAWKAAALRCYSSQLEHPPTAPWFGSDQREFVAP